MEPFIKLKKHPEKPLTPREVHFINARKSESESAPPPDLIAQQPDGASMARLASRHAQIGRVVSMIKALAWTSMAA